MGGDEKIVDMNQRMEIAAEKPNVSEKAYQRLRSMILEHELAPGSVVGERRLADTLEASRTPLRSAIVRLEGEGLVERLDNGSLVIREVSVEELLEILSVRRLLETEAAGLCARRVPKAEIDPLIAESRTFASGESVDFDIYWQADDRFHEAIAWGSGKPVLARLIVNLRSQARMCHVTRMPTIFAEQGSEHLAVLSAIAQKDAAGSRRAMRAHLDNVRRRLLRWLSAS